MELHNTNPINEMDFSIKPFVAAHFPMFAKIYREGIATGNATFETEVPDWESWDRSHIESCRIAAWEGGHMLGWAALSKVSGRCVYGGVAEVSVYVAQAARARGVGMALLTQLVTQSEDAGFWTLQAGIFPENIPSIHIHERCGFRKVGYREKIGLYNNRWRDTLLMERRSQVVGI